MPTRSFRDLIVWQRAIELAISVYTTTKSFPKEETFGMASQLRRASVSIPSNIAEGADRITPANSNTSSEWPAAPQQKSKRNSSSLAVSN